jgi:hypothetical protein
VTCLLLLGLVLDELLLLLQYFQTLFVGRFGRSIQLCLVKLESAGSLLLMQRTYQVLWQTAQSRDQTIHYVVSFLFKVECSTENQQDTRYSVRVMQLNPLV